jgi:uncharacterized protein with LGFP repeats
VEGARKNHHSPPQHLGKLKPQSLSLRKLRFTSERDVRQEYKLQTAYEDSKTVFNDRAAITKELQAMLAPPREGLAGPDKRGRGQSAADEDEDEVEVLEAPAAKKGKGPARRVR